MIKRIIFDIDGTLIAGVNFSSYVTNTFKRYGIENIENTKQFLLNINLDDVWLQIHKKKIN